MTLKNVTSAWVAFTSKDAPGRAMFTCGLCGWFAGSLVYQTPTSQLCRVCKRVWAPQTVGNLGFGLILVGAATGSRGVIVCDRRPRRPRR